MKDAVGQMCKKGRTIGLAGGVLVVTCLTAANAYAPVAPKGVWIASGVQGAVFVVVDGRQMRVRDGVGIPNDLMVVTAPGSQVRLTRNGETIDVAPDTQIVVHDRTDKEFTHVWQYSGSVTVEANREQVKHFAVETPYVAAVVKGTIFQVSTGRTGSQTRVDRGRVEVVDFRDKQKVDVLPGQSAHVTATSGLNVSGVGQIQRITTYAAPNAAATAASAAATSVTAVSSVTGVSPAAAASAVAAVSPSAAAAVSAATNNPSASGFNKQNAAGSPGGNNGGYGNNGGNGGYGNSGGFGGNGNNSGDGGNGNSGGYGGNGNGGGYGGNGNNGGSGNNGGGNGNNGGGGGGSKNGGGGNAGAHDYSFGRSSYNNADSVSNGGIGGNGYNKQNDRN